MAIPAKTIVQLTAYPAPALLGSELLEISAGGFSYKINSRMFPLATDSLITVSGMGGSLPGSRQLAAGTGIQLVDNGAGSTLQIFATGVGALPANPTGLIGLAAVNGVAPTWTRSDATHALDQGIAPTWTGVHTFTAGSVPNTPSIRLQSNRPIEVFIEDDAAADNGRWFIDAQAEQFRMATLNDAGSSSVVWLTVDRTGTVVDSIALSGAAVSIAAQTTITGSNTRLSRAGTTRLLLDSTDAPANEHLWEIRAENTGNMVFLTRTDADGAGTTWMTATRTGTTIDDVTFTFGTASVALAVGTAPNTPSLRLTSNRPIQVFVESDAAADNGRWFIDAQSEQFRFATLNDAGAASTPFFVVDRTGITVDAIALTSTALTWNGNPLLSTATAFANPTASVGLAAVNGAATTAMRSDAAPALSVAITPTWTGQHTFSNAVTLFSNNAPLIRMTDADGAADAKTWQWDLSVANALSLTTVTDAIGAGATVLTITRSGTTVSNVTSAQQWNFTKAGTGIVPTIQVNSTLPMMLWNETDGAVDNRLWREYANSEQRVFEAINDAGTISNPWMTVDRTAAVIDSVTFPAKIISTVVASSTTNTYALSMESSVPFWQLRETDGAANNQRWHFGAQGEAFSASVVSDDGLTAAAWIAVDRTGTTVDQVRFPSSAAQTFLVGASVGLFTNRMAIFNTSSPGTLAAVNTGGAANSCFDCHNSAIAGDNVFIIFFTEAGGTTRGSIDYNRAGGLTRYNTTSDRRLKHNIVDAEPAGDILDAIRVRSFDWKDSDAHLDHWLVAQELYEVFPNAVSKGDDADELTKDGKQWALDATHLIPLMIKELQDLRARVRDLESKPTTH